MRCTRFGLILLLLSVGFAAFCQTMSKGGHEVAGHSAQTHSRPAGLQVSPWPKFHQNSSNTGLGIAGGSNGLQRWSYSSAGSSFYASPVIGADGTIYVGSDFNGFFALNPDGTKKWSFATGQIYFSAVLGSVGTIYLGTSDKHLYAINPDGSQKWRFATQTYPSYEPAIGPDGTIYMGTDGGTLSKPTPGLFAVNPDGTMKWSALPGRLILSPAIGSDGTIYVSSDDKNLYAINTDGTTKWRFLTGASMIGSSPAIGVDGTVYVGSNDNNLYAVNPDGTKKWSFATGNKIESSPAIGADGTIYVGSSDNYLYAVNPDGTLKWRFAAGSNVASSPAIASDGTIYFGQSNGYLYAVNPDGSLLWRFLGHTGNPIFSSPAIAADGTVYVGSLDSNLYAIGTQVGSVPVSNLTVNPSTVVGGSNSTGTVTLSTAAPSGGDIVTLVSGDASVVVPAFVTVPGGATTASFSISTKSVASNKTVIITATSGSVNATASLTLQALGVSSVSISPSSIVGGNVPTGGTVTLTVAAPTGGTVVNLSSGNACVTVPSSVTVAAGSKTATFAVSTSGVDASTPVTVTATLGVTSTTFTLTVTPAKAYGLQLSPSSVAGDSNTPVTGTVNLNGYAGPSGATVSLSSSNTSVATVPATVTVAAGAKSATFAVTHLPVSSNQSSTISASLGGTTVTAVLSVQSVSLAGVSTPNMLQIVGGNTPNPGLVSLTGNAPAGGLTVSLSSSSSCLSVPASVTVASGATSASFAMSTAGVDTSASVTITATSGSVTKKCVVTVLPASLTGLQLTPSSVAGDSSTPVSAILALNGNAGPSGTIISLTSSNTSVATVPASVTVPAGAHSVSVAVTHLPVSSTQTSTISATLGANTVNGVLSVVSVTLASVWTPNMFQIVGGNTPNPGQVVLTGNAPAGGFVVNLSSNDSHLTVPASVTVPAGSSAANFAMTTSGVDTTTAVTITATSGSATKTCVVSLLPAVIWDITLSTNTVVGSSATVVTARVRLNGYTGSSGATITLTSSNTSAATVPATLTLPAGAHQGTFVVTQLPVGTTQTTTLTASFRSTTATTTLTVTP